MADRAPKKLSLAGLVMGEATQIRDLATMANKRTTSRKDAALYLASAMQHTAEIFDLLQKMAAGPNLEMPEWFTTIDITEIPRPQE